LAHLVDFEIIILIIISTDYKSNTMISIDIGCSIHKLPGYIGVDLDPLPSVDVVANMESLPFSDSTIDLIHTRHTFEHVKDPHKCLTELYRVSKSTGNITIIVPHYSNHTYWADMTHIRPFSYRSFEYFDLEYAKLAGFPIYLPKVNIKTLSAKLVYWPERIYNSKSFVKRNILKIFDRIISGIANKSPFICERIWCYWVGGFYEVKFDLQPVKQNITKDLDK